MDRAGVTIALLTWAGTTLLLASHRSGCRGRLADRARPYLAGASRRRPPSRLVSASSFREVIGPLVQETATAVSRGFGSRGDLAARLRWVGATDDVAAFRMRQAGWAGLGSLAGLALGLVGGLPPLVTLALAPAGALGAFLLVEQRLLAAAARRQARLFDELPVVTEQIGMLLSAGYSLGAALQRLADRGSGVCAEDLGTVTNRVRQGLSETEALREWADLADVPELHRLVAALVLNRHTGDLGRLIAEEARSARREAHRRTIEVIERRGQLVWAPVTVATLVPGVMLMAVPFVAALQAWSAL